LLVVISRALDKDTSNDNIVRGALRILLRGGVPLDGDCRLIASVLGDGLKVWTDS
jgi:hypothetical protein